MTAHTAEWLTEMAQSGWSPTGIQMLRKKIAQYGLDWVAESEPKIRQFARTATNSALALHAFELLEDEEIDAAVESWVEGWHPSSR
jgi:hypothetical protein